MHPHHVLINRTSAVPIYEQICNSISDRIISEQCFDGEQLPSVRELSTALQVSLVTVQKAYRLLAKRGLITSEKGRGNFVKKGTTAKDAFHLEHGNSSNKPWQMDIQDYIPRSQVLKHINSVQTDVIHKLSVANFHRDVLPVAWIQGKAKQAIDKYPDALVDYSSSVGDPAFLQAAQKYIESIGVKTDTKHMLTVSGSQQAIELIAKTFLSYGDSVIIESPTYIGYIDVLRARGVRIISVPVDYEGLQTHRLIELCERYKPKLLFTNPTFQNPTGTTLSLKRRQELIDIAESFQLIIVEDDIWSELYFQKKPPLPIKSFDSSGCVIYIKSYSKILATGCRVAVVVADQPILNRLIAAKSISDLGSPLITQVILAELLSSPELQGKMVDIRKALARRVAMTYRYLQTNLPKAVHEQMIWYQPQGGLFLWLQLPSGVHDENLLQEAIRNRLTFLPGSACYAGGEEQRFIRISYAHASEEMLEDAIITLCDVLKSEINRVKDNIYYPIT
ncbi:hypothetical protein BHU72_14925 [Desulfuribacillus stibiiarsenatis]|uniref:HTH gntR-type domain-containing protein n=1 Tax=Desulfuribacillus stibiiarsenatis TaxID=1390249 RepID=A0A1E5L799_9FIRM|nr:PLP-dependent aminotransferase family protein [Desulfuribacillus stibiiarsenatis]OEH85996.1 hypothetical protein BHU72_14925 [Desulfuribacillus stibiiarsenatis]